MTPLTFVIGWIVVSALCMVFFAVGATLGYRRGWDDRGAQLRRVDDAAHRSQVEAQVDLDADLPLRDEVSASRR